MLDFARRRDKTVRDILTVQIARRSDPSLKFEPQISLELE